MRLFLSILLLCVWSAHADVTNRGYFTFNNGSEVDSALVTSNTFADSYHGVGTFLVFGARSGNYPVAITESATWSSTAQSPITGAVSLAGQTIYFSNTVGFSTTTATNYHIRVVATNAVTNFFFRALWRVRNIPEVADVFNGDIQTGFFRSGFLNVDLQSRNGDFQNAFENQGDNNTAVTGLHADTWYYTDIKHLNGTNYNIVTGYLTNYIGGVTSLYTSTVSFSNFAVGLHSFANVAFATGRVEFAYIYCDVSTVILDPAPFPTLQTTTPSPSASGGNATVAVGWSDVLYEDGYQVKRSITSGSGFTVRTNLTAASTGFTDADVTNGVTYYYLVSSTNQFFASQSGEASATPQNPPTTLNGVTLRGVSAR